MTRLAEVEAQLAGANGRVTDLEESARRLANENDALVVRVKGLESGLRNALAAIDRDRSGLSDALIAVRDHAKGSWWITEGRGSYEWDDDRYKAETFACLRRIIVLADDGLLASGRLADTEYKLARAALESNRPSEMPAVLTCAACSLPFQSGELRSIRPDGSSMHDETQPDSMRRCREALLLRLASR